MFESDLLIKYEKLISQTSLLQLLKMQFIRANIMSILSFQEQWCDVTFNVVFMQLLT